jgi:hypothetical protein
MISAVVKEAVRSEVRAALRNMLPQVLPGKEKEFLPQDEFRAKYGNISKGTLQEAVRMGRVEKLELTKRSFLYRMKEEGE